MGMTEWITSRFTCEESAFWAEQPHVFVAIARALRKYHKVPSTPDVDCARYLVAGVSGSLPKPRVANAGGSLRELQLNITRCLDAVGRGLNLSVGHYNTKLKAPVAWSWGPSHHKFPNRDIGLGLNLLFQSDT